MAPHITEQMSEGNGIDAIMEQFAKAIIGSSNGAPAAKVKATDPESDAESSEEEEEKTYLPPGTLCKVRDLYQTPPDKEGRRSWTTAYPDDLEEPPENAEAAQYALVLRHVKCYDGRRKLQLKSIVVQSEHLKGVLGKVFEHYTGVTTNLERLEFNAPFQPFVHRWEQFTEARDAETDPATREHMDLLHKVLEEELRDTIAEKRDLLAKGVMTYEMLWAIFEPGTLVYANIRGVDRAFVLNSGRYLCDPVVYMLNLRYVDCDGEDFGTVSQDLAVPAFAGTAPITSLAAFPLSHHPDLKRVKETLIARGRQFVSYKGYHFKAYKGIATGYGPWGQYQFSVNGRVIVDTYAFGRFNTDEKVYVSRIKSADKPSEDGSTLTEKHLLCCSNQLRGYSLKDKKWMKFPMAGLREIEWSEHAFASLVAPPEQKELILAFAQTQSKSKETFDDVISGKGRGIIMLLSGPPGVGKTLTAESVAEVMRVPLYTMSAGDLGTRPSDVEESLSNILEMSNKWNAILLLDEADVFLEARSAHDLERNKLVSIFLRLLEYYEGILFLTTNRVENIDAAFESRIHLSLQYEDLDRDARRHVWDAFLGRSVAAGADVFSADELDRLAERQLNGRQIKNILKTAQLLATKKEETLCFAHIDTVLRLRDANRHGLKNGLTNGSS